MVSISTFVIVDPVFERVTTAVTTDLICAALENVPQLSPRLLIGFELPVTVEVLSGIDADLRHGERSTGLERKLDLLIGNDLGCDEVGWIVIPVIRDARGVLRHIVIDRCAGTVRVAF